MLAAERVMTAVYQTSHTKRQRSTKAGREALLAIIDGGKPLRNLVQETIEQHLPPDQFEGAESGRAIRTRNHHPPGG
jgi:hypothetical protein